VLGVVSTFLGNLLTTWRDALIGGAGSLVGTITDLAGALVGGMQQAGAQAAAGILDGLKNGVLQGISGNFFGTLWDSLQKAANAAQLAQSPSQLWAQNVGAPAGQGTVKGYGDAVTAGQGAIGQRPHGDAHRDRRRGRGARPDGGQLRSERPSPTTSSPASRCRPPTGASSSRRRA
jgi:hypothetical protein